MTQTSSPRHRAIRIRCGALRQTLSALLAVMLICAPAVSPTQEWTYTVRPGDNLWTLSERYLQSHEYWPKLQDLNQVDDPLKLQPGQRLRFPLAWMKHQPKPAHIVAVSGEATFTAADGTRRQATQGQTLNTGDSLITTAGSSLSIKFADGSTMRVDPETEVVMDTLGAFSETGMVDTSVRIRHGRVENKVVPQKPNSRFRAITPGAVAAVRGTEFRISADDNGGTMRGEVLEGKIDVSAAGVTVAVPTGFATIVEAGKPPIPPRQLPPAPDLGGLSKRFAQANVRFLWLPVNGAVAYRVQLASDASFTTLLQEQVTDTHRVSWQGLVPGDYVMRVRAIDTLKIEGLDATHQFTIIAPPAAPLPTTPEQDAVITHGKPWMAWANAPDATGYRVQIAADADFKDDLQTINGIVNNNYKPPRDLPPGHYYWRVAKASGTIVSQFSEPRGFIITTVPAKPDALQHTTDKTRVTFSWNAVADARQYHFQLAEDSDFRHIHVDSTINDPGFVIEQAVIGEFYYRVAAINEHGVTGSFSAANTLIVKQP